MERSGVREWNQHQRQDPKGCSQVHDENPNPQITEEPGGFTSDRERTYKGHMSDQAQVGGSQLNVS